MSTPQIDTEPNAMIENASRHLLIQTRRENGSNVIRIVIALTIDVTIDGQTAMPNISNIAVISRTV